MTTPDHQRPTALGWLVDLAVYAPLGLAITLRDDLPRYVQTGKQTVAGRVQVARWIGEMAVTQGRRELERRLGDRRSAPASPAPASTGPEPADAADPPAAEGPDQPSDPRTGELPDRPAEASAEEVGTGPVLDAADLPIEGYESLPALNIVQRLAGLSRSELDDVGRFEAAHRKRRTILAKVEQLQAS